MQSLMFLTYFFQKLSEKNLVIKALQIPPIPITSDNRYYLVFGLLVSLLHELSIQAIDELSCVA